jgi:peptidylprolyl isomerase domain and WD repeat-containing protein 1
MEEQPKNGNSETPVENDEDKVIGPGPAPKARAKRPLQFEQAYLDSLPSANM